MRRLRTLAILCEIGSADLPREQEESVETSASCQISAGQSQEEVELNQTEKNLLETLGTDRLTGEDLAEKAKYPFNSNIKARLAGLVKLGILGNDRHPPTRTHLTVSAERLSRVVALLEETSLRIVQVDRAKLHRHR